MRLIDADKLPYAMKDYFDGKKTIGQIIDDAPTIEMAEDCVKRDDAIRLAEQGQIQGFEWQFKQLAMLPSVTPQPKMGEWIRPYKFSAIYECSVCYKQIPITDEFYYCPNCGAKMEVQDANNS